MVNRKTRHNEAIRRAIAEAGRPLSPTEVREAAQAEVPELGMATVYRALKRLVDDGIAVPVQLPGESPRYECHEVAAHHHHHFHCNDCDRVYDIPGCPKGLEKLAPPGFRLSGHELVLYGQCQACMAPERKE